MYSVNQGLILGFHACDASVAERVVNIKDFLRPSENDYDWLGHGIYFWEKSYLRALDYANHLKNNPHKSKTPVKNPAVIGAVLSLGFCLDLMALENLQFLKQSFQVLQITRDNEFLPQNKKTGNIDELLLRNLDCAVIETLHEIRKKSNQSSFDSVRGVFWEGKELYPNAGFREKDHIQICVRNPNCIKGFFLPRKEDEDFSKVMEPMTEYLFTGK